MIKNSLSLILLFLFSVELIAQTPCENGAADGFSCNQIDLLSTIDNDELAGTNGVDGTDIWGWTDPVDQTEYVLMAQTNGIVFVDISDPINPIIIGRLPSYTNVSSPWRDVKVYNNHAFVVADNNPGHGMQIFDLTRLRDVSNPPEEFDTDAHYSGVSSAHNVVINEQTGFAYIVGARNGQNGCGRGGLHIVNIQNPKKPKYAGCFDADGYTHDAQCVIYQGADTQYQGQEICFNANENTITISNVEDKENTQLISKQGYPSSAYSHQGWLTEDHHFFISNDELDEQTTGMKTRTLIWDVRDLDNPILLGEYLSERFAIDHNLYTKDDKIYQSNYNNGLIILDGKRVADANIRDLAYFDTYPQGNTANFNGSWSNYPYFESGVVAVSDINNGLFIVQPQIKEIITEHPVFSSCGNEAVLNIKIAEGYTVSSYQWQILDGSSFENLRDNDDYSGVDSVELTINPELVGLADLRYRCKIELENGEVLTSYLSNKVEGLPNVVFDANLNDLEVQFQNNTLGGQSYEWDFGDGSDVSTEPNPKHTYAEINNYEVKLTASNECGSSEFTYNVNLTQCLPTADFTVSVDDGAISFINLSTNSDSFEWDFGDGSTIVTDKNPEYEYQEEGAFEVTLKVSNACGESSKSMTIDASVLSNGNALDKFFTVYPNPVENQLFLESESAVDIVDFTVLSADGKQYHNSNTFDNAKPIEVYNWERGIYFLILTDKQGDRAVKKIIKK